MSNLYGEAVKAFEQLGGNAVAVDAAFNAVDVPGVEVQSVEVGRPLGDFPDRVVAGQISGQETVIDGSGRKPEASIKIVFDASVALAELIQKRREEIEGLLGRKIGSD